MLFFKKKDSQTAYEDKQRDDSVLSQLASCLVDDYLDDSSLIND